MKDEMGDCTALAPCAPEAMESSRASAVEEERVISILNKVLAAELDNVQRYKRLYFAAEILDAQCTADEFLEHAVAKADQAGIIAARISQLGGTPNLDAEALSSGRGAHAVASRGLGKMIEDDLVAQKIAMASYAETIDFLGDGDPFTRRLIERILEQEEEHASGIHYLLSGIH